MRVVARTLSFMACLSVSVAGCGVLHTMHEDHTGQQHAPPSAPQASIAAPELTQHPTSAELTAHFCAALAPEGSLSHAAATACRALGAAPAEDDLAFATHVDLALTSSNPVSISVASVLLVLTAYPDSGDTANVGAVCITLCNEHASACPQSEDACRSTDDSVHDLDDAHASAGFLVAPALDAHRFRELERVIVRPHGSATLSIDLAIAAAQLLGVMQRVDSAPMGAIRAGHAPSFAIPYAIDGALWVDSNGSARSAASLPRVTGTWEIPSP